MAAIRDAKRNYSAKEKRGGGTCLLREQPRHAGRRPIRGGFLSGDTLGVRGRSQRGGTRCGVRNPRREDSGGGTGRVGPALEFRLELGAGRSCGKHWLPDVR